ncbi:MAG: TrkA C-terminal domain-containing protein [Thermodesulfobacteriota bacterium]
MNVTEVVLPEFEAGLEMTRQVLLHLRVPVVESQRHTESLRQELFAPILNAVGGYKTLAQLRPAEQQFDLQRVLLEAGSPCLDKTIAETEIRKATGASIVGVVRDGKLEPNPGTQFRFRMNDLVAVIGSEQSREGFKRPSRPVAGSGQK